MPLQDANPTPSFGGFGLRQAMSISGHMALRRKSVWKRLSCMSVSLKEAYPCDPVKICVSFFRVPTAYISFSFASLLAELLTTNPHGLPLQRLNPH